MKTCLTIAGSDCSGGAGIQADLKTFAAHGVYGMSVITALTAQNTTGVKAVHSVPPEFVSEQIAAVESDIPPDAIKLGMLANAEIIEHVADALALSACSKRVLDPVMVATSGDALLNDNAVETLVEKLIPQVSIITPNIPELVALSTALNIDIPNQVNRESIESLTQSLFNKLGIGSLWVLSKGGHMTGDTADDYLYCNNGGIWLSDKRVDAHNTHGTGCTLSAAIAANLSLGKSMLESVSLAKEYLSAALNRGLDLGQGSGPLWH